MFVLQILKVIGLILLSVLLLILFLVLLVLFVPIRYRASAEYKEDISAEGRITWLLSMIRLNLSYHRKKAGYQLFLFGIPIYPRKKRKKEKPVREMPEPGKKPAQKAPEPEKKSVQKAPEPEKKSVQKAPETGEKPVQVIPEAGEKPVQVIPEAGEKPVQETPETGEKPVQEITEPEEKPEQEMPEPGEKTEQETPEPEEKPVREITVSGEKPAQESSEEGETAEEEETEPAGEKSRENGFRQATGQNSDKVSEIYEPTAQMPAEVKNAGTAGEKKKTARRPAEEKRKKVSYDSVVSDLKNRAEKFGQRIAAVREKKEMLTSPGMKAAIEKVFHLGLKALKHVLPRKPEGFVHFGFEDPALTGGILGALSMVYAASEGRFTAEPDFTEKCLEGNINARGRIVPAYLLLIGLRLLLDRNIRRQYKLIKGDKADGKEVK